jgi:hypothetical protein
MKKITSNSGLLGTLAAHRLVLLAQQGFKSLMKGKLVLGLVFVRKFFAITRELTFLFAWLISHQPTLFFSQSKSVTSNQPAVLFSQNKPTLVISHQPNEHIAN